MRRGRRWVYFSPGILLAEPSPRGRRSHTEVDTSCARQALRSCHGAPRHCPPPHPRSTGIPLPSRSSPWTFRERQRSGLFPGPGRSPQSGVGAGRSPVESDIGCSLTTFFCMCRGDWGSLAAGVAVPVAFVSLPLLLVRSEAAVPVLGVTCWSLHSCWEESGRD